MAYRDDISTISPCYPMNSDYEEISAMASPTSIPNNTNCAVSKMKVCLFLQLFVSVVLIGWASYEYIRTDITVKNIPPTTTSIYIYTPTTTSISGTSNIIPTHGMTVSPPNGNGDPIIRWTREKNASDKCIFMHDGSNFEIKKRGFYTITCKIAYKSTPNKNTFRVELYLKRNNKKELLASFEKFSQGPTTIWLYSKSKHFHNGDDFFVTYNFSQYVKKGSIYIKPSDMSCIPQIVEMAQTTRCLVQVEEGDSDHNTGETNDQIMYYKPPRDICFNISRNGLYYMWLSVKVDCTGTESQWVPVMRKGKSLDNPEILINAAVCGKHNSTVSEHKYFKALKLDEVCLTSGVCLDRYEHNFIRIVRQPDY